MKQSIVPLLALCLTGCANDQDLGALGGRAGQGPVAPVIATQPTVTPTVARFLDISGTGQAFNLGDDDSVSVAIGFTFPVQGRSFSTVNICSNGFLSFGTGEKSFVNTPLPSPQAPAPMLAAYWTDLTSPGGFWVFAESQGVAPRRQLVVQWKNAQSTMGTPKGITFEAILKEDGSAEVQYLDTNFGAAQFNAGALATAGLQAGGLGAQLCFNGSTPLSSNTGFVMHF